MAAPIKFGVGQSVLRKEDDALIRGKGRYTDDYAPQAALRCLMLRFREIFDLVLERLDLPSQLVDLLFHWPRALRAFRRH